MTEYVVLKAEVATSEASEDLWRHVRYVDAATSDSAIRKLVEADDESGTFVAIPKRSFDPKVVSRVTKVKLA